MRYVFALTILLSAAQLPASLNATFSTDTVAITGATPNGQVVALAGTFVNERFTMRRRFESIASQADSHGTAIFTRTEKTPLQSVWIFVDVSTGISVETTSRGLAPIALPGAATVVKRDAEDQIESILTGGNGFQMMVVRPRQGAWSQAFYDGANDDDRTTNGIVNFSFSALRPIVGADGPPKKLRNGDVVVLLDTTHLLCSVFQIVPGGRQ